MVLLNWAWLLRLLDQISGLKLEPPPGTPAPNMSAARPHTRWPTPVCGRDPPPVVVGGGGRVLFCDGFDLAAGEVAAGLYQWQRNQSFYDAPQVRLQYCPSTTL